MKVKEHSNNGPVQRAAGRLATIAGGAEVSFRHNIELLEGEQPVGSAIEAVRGLGGDESIGAPGDFDSLSAG